MHSPSRAQWLACYALAATVILRVPMATMETTAYTPLSVVLSQIVIPIPDTPAKPGDPGDLVRAMMYPGALVTSVWDAYTCATSDAPCDPEKAEWLPRWKSFVSVRGLKGVDETVSRVFAGKKSQVIASSFFAFGASFQALTRGNAGVLGLFSAVTLLWSLLGAMADASVACSPQWGLLAYLVLVYHTMNIAARARAARERKRKAANKKKKEEEEKKKVA